MTDVRQHPDDPAVAHTTPTGAARNASTSLLWLRKGWPTVHRVACECAACEALTQHERMCLAVNSGQYEVDE